MSALMPETLRKTTKPKNEFNLANQHKAIASICVIKKDQYVDVSTHARDEQAKLRCPHRFSDVQTKHKQPDARQCKHKSSAVDSKPRALYNMP